MIGCTFNQIFFSLLCTLLRLCQSDASHCSLKDFCKKEEKIVLLFRLSVNKMPKSPLRPPRVSSLTAAASVESKDRKGSFGNQSS